jgi:hypothetical protein
VDGLCSFCTRAFKIARIFVGFFSAEEKLLHDFLGRRKLWIIGLSIAAVLLGKSLADGWIEHYNRFDEANRLATGHIVEVDPGEPASGSGEGADPGSPPSSHYQFQVNGITYDGWIEDELSEGEEILIRYNSSDPSLITHKIITRALS